MNPVQLAQILIRVMALFLIWKSIETGFSQFVMLDSQMGMVEQTYRGDEGDGMAAALAKLKRMAILTSLMPLFLAGALWKFAPSLAEWMSPKFSPCGEEKRPLPLQLTLVQVAGILFIALAAASIPRMILMYQSAIRQNPEFDWRTSHISYEAALILGELLVGLVMLVAVKLQVRKKPVLFPDGEAS